MERRAVAAWDPGESGAIAIRHSTGLVSTYKNPDCVTKLHAIMTSNNVGTVIFEKQHYCGGSFRVSSVAMGHFGEHVGGFLATFRLMGIKAVGITPTEWQKRIDIQKSPRQKKVPEEDPNCIELNKSVARANAKAKTVRKRALRDHAQKIYKHLKVTLTNCDALLMLHYASH